MDNKNTLQITAQYPAERYNLLVPMQTVAEIAEIHKPVMNAVQISTNEADKEIYLQDRSKAKADGWALTKRASTSSCEPQALRFWEHARLSRPPVRSVQRSTRALAGQSTAEPAVIKM